MEDRSTKEKCQKFAKIAKKWPLRHSRDIYKEMILPLTVLFVWWYCSWLSCFTWVEGAAADLSAVRCFVLTVLNCFLCVMVRAVWCGSVWLIVVGGCWGRWAVGWPLWGWFSDSNQPFWWTHDNKKWLNEETKRFVNLCCKQMANWTGPVVILSSCFLIVGNSTAGAW